MERYNLLFKREEDLDRKIGTTMTEPFFLITPMFMAIMLIQLIPPFFSSIRENHWTEMALDFSLLVIPLLGTVTVAADFVAYISLMLVIAVAAFTFVLKKRQLQLRTLQERKFRIDFLTNARGALYLNTVICILAVDFQLFPERLHKTTSFGFGLMDVGVGSFVLHSGLVSKEARIHEGSRWHRLKCSDFLNSLKSSAVLMAIGFARLLLTHATDYSVAVEEYGRHWNFFFTLAIVQVICDVIVMIVPLNVCGAVSVVAILIQQAILLNGDFVYWLIEDDDRVTLIEANKEGVFSIPGYIAIYFAGLQGGRLLFSERQTNNEWVRVMAILGIITGVLIPGTMLVSVYVQPTSRRMANLAYYLWIIWYNVIFLLFFLVCEMFLKFVSGQTESKGKLKTVPFLLEAINQNGLMFFLVANVLTGCVNLLMETSSVGAVPALLILCTYMAVCLSFVSYLKIKKIRLK